MAIQSKSSRSSSYRRKESLFAWLFSTPAIILLLVFLIVPFVLAIGMSFTNMRLIPNPNVPTRFVGFRNYIRLITDQAFLKGLFNNFYFVLIVVPLQTAFALGLALLINKELRGMNIYRTAYFSPVVTSMTVVSIVWTLLYNPGEGLINAFLNAISFGLIEPQSWLTNPKLREAPLFRLPSRLTPRTNGELLGYVISTFVLVIMLTWIGTSGLEEIAIQLQDVFNSL